VALEVLKAEIGILLEAMTNPAHDRFELYMQIKEKLNEMRAFGMPPPDDLVQLEAELDREFAEERRRRHGIRSV
jgi:small-conductance mechanosensitive channel